jgi:hypothetical protein
MLFSTRDLQDARRLEDPFNLVAGVEGTVFAKGLENSGVVNESLLKFLDTLLQSGILRFNSSNGIIKSIISYVVK